MSHFFSDPNITLDRGGGGGKRIAQEVGNRARRDGSAVPGAFEDI